MRIFDFFRTRELVEERVGDLSYNEVGKVFGGRVEILRKKEDEVLFEIRRRFEGFYISVEEKLRVLEEIDIEGKKEHDRTKILVRQGLDKYVGFVRVLLKKLKKLKKENLVRFTGDVGRVFVGFEKGSARVYERATYLIGDEMAVVRNEIRQFYNGLLRMFEKEKLLIGDLRMVKDVKVMFGKVEIMKKKLKVLGREVLVNDDGIEKARKEIGKLKEEVEVIKNSSEYVAYLKLKDEVEVLSSRIEREVLKLKGFVDFKKLIGIVHSSERDLRIVKGYRDGFVSEFSLDGSERLVGILKDCGMMSSEIVGQVGLIGKLKKELNEKRDSIGVDVCVSKLVDMKRIEENIEGMEISEVKIRRRLEEVGERLDGLKGEVVGLVGGLGKV